MPFSPGGWRWRGMGGAAARFFAERSVLARVLSFSGTVSRGSGHRFSLPPDRTNCPRCWRRWRPRRRPARRAVESRPRLPLRRPRPRNDFPDRATPMGKSSHLRLRRGDSRVHGLIAEAPAAASCKREHPQTEARGTWPSARRGRGRKTNEGARSCTGGLSSGHSPRLPPRRTSRDPRLARHRIPSIAGGNRRIGHRRTAAEPVARPLRCSAPSAKCSRTR